jgi:hypothetical protein
VGYGQVLLLCVYTRALGYSSAHLGDDFEASLIASFTPERLKVALKRIT